MKVAIFWGDIPFNQDNKQAAEVLKYYLIEKSLNIGHNSFFTSFMGNINQFVPEIRLNPDGIINKDDKIDISFFIEKNSGQKNEKYQAIFILAELNWNGHLLSEFYGIKIAQQLRLNDIKAPIFICSFITENFLINEKSFLILQSMGHYFIQLPIGITKDYEIRLLEDIELKDIKFHFCGLTGIIRTLFHNAKQEADRITRSGTEKIEEAKSKMKSQIEHLLKFPDLPDLLQKEIKHIIDEIINIGEPSDLNKFIKKEESVLLSYLEDKGSSDDIIKKVLEWEILLLEDFPEEASEFIELLNEQGIKIRFATNYDNAIKEIDEDKGNKITVVISDYRLEDENGSFKSRQGYSFIEWLSKQSRFNEIFVLSHLSRNFLKETFYSYSIRVNIESKSNIRGKNTESLVDFVNKIIEAGNQTCKIIHSLPSGEGWKMMDLFYAHFRKIPQYNLIEHEISAESGKIIKQINHLRETAEISGLTIEDLQKLPLFSGIKTLKNLTGRLCNPVNENTTIIDNRLVRLIFDEKEQKNKLYLFQDPTDAKYFSYFKNKMIARRIAWWLLFIEGLSSNTVYSLLMYGEYFNKNVEKESNDAKTLINTRLAVKKEDFPSNLLLEEKNWFKYEMGVDLEDLISVICGFEHYFYELFESFIPKMNPKSHEFAELKRAFITNDMFLFHSANDIRKALELSIKSLENTNDKRDLIYKVLDRFYEDDIICKPYFDKLENYARNQIKLLKNK